MRSVTVERGTWYRIQDRHTEAAIARVDEFTAWCKVQGIAPLYGTERYIRRFERYEWHGAFAAEDVPAVEAWLAAHGLGSEDKAAPRIEVTARLAGEESE